jgi:dUTP pyrophosphatase
MNIKFKKLHKEAHIPTQGSKGAGGWDLYAAEITEVAPDEVIVHLGFALAPPPGYRVTFVPRSSFTKNRWVLQNSPTLGDPDYRGEYKVRFRAIPSRIIQSSGGLKKPILGYPKFPYEVGDRVAQMYLEEIIPIEFEVVKDLDDTERGAGGFGSTGK